MTASSVSASVEAVARSVIEATGDAGDDELLTTSRTLPLIRLGRAAQRIHRTDLLLDEAGSLVAGALQLPMFAAGMLDPDNQLLVVRTGSPEDQHGVQRRLREERGLTTSALSFALDASGPVVIDDLAGETRFRDQKLIQDGARSGIVCAITHGRQRYGVLGVFSSRRYEFSPDDVLLVYSATMQLGLAIAHQRTAKQLRDQSHCLAATFDSLDALVVLLNEQYEILSLNRTGQQLSGFAGDEVRLRSFCGAFLLPQDVSQVRTAIDRSRASATVTKCNSVLLTKRGQRRLVSWTFSPFPLRSARGPVTIASARDVTDQQAALQRLRDLERQQIRREVAQGAAVPPDNKPSGTPDLVPADRTPDRPGG